MYSARITGLGTLKTTCNFSSFIFISTNREPLSPLSQTLHPPNTKPGYGPAVLAFYDVKKPVTVSYDASNFGLGAVLLQENKPIPYASLALTDTEKQYAQIEKELLAVVYALEKFNQYVYGKAVQVESDHKPLESITKKSLCQAPPRLQRMLL